MRQVANGHLFEVVGSGGRHYRTHPIGIQRDDGTCEGYIEFAAEDGTTLRTPAETVQSSWEALQYWASGLHAIYLEGAFRRAQNAPPLHGA